MNYRLFIMAAATCAAFAQAPAKRPAVWIGPPGIDDGKALRSLWERPDQWAQTRAMVDGILYADHLIQKQFSDDDLRVWFARMREWNLKLSLEVGSIKEWGPTGEATFNKQAPIWDRIQRLGGTIHSICMDESLVCTRKKLHKPDEYAVAETAKFIALVRQRYPKILITEIEAYPSTPLKDHFWWIESLNQRLREKGVRELDAYRLDVNWINFTVQQVGAWKEVKQLEVYCRQHNLPFSLIYWPANLPSLKRIQRYGESTWYLSIMNQGQDYALVGGAPDEYVVESWVGEPPNTVPDTAEWTFTRSAADSDADPSAAGCQTGTYAPLGISIRQGSRAPAEP